MEGLFEYYIETDNFHFKYAKGEPALKEQEFHDYNEFVFFIEGSSYFISKNIQGHLIPGSVVIIPKEHFHQFCVNQPKTYLRCILGFRETAENRSLVHEVMNEIKLVSSPNEIIVGVFENLIRIITGNLTDSDKKLFIGSALNQLLIFFKQYANDATSKSVRLSPLVSKALNIIDENYTQSLSVERLSDIICVSESTLAHKFKEELNISVYRYITKKRLCAVKELVSQGETLSNAALKCGFNDYSCFYRLYKKYYQK